MGLFDRFKKRFKKSSEEDISVEEDSSEAKQATEEGVRMRQDISKMRETHIAPAPKEDPDDDWDDEEESAPDPFTAAPTDRKQRKKAQRAASVELAEKPKEPEQANSPPEPMQTTTGRTLVASGPVEIEVDFGDAASKTGGRVIKGSAKLDSMLEELEEELLTSDMAQGAAEEVILALKANLIGNRISTVKKIDLVLEEALRNTLLKLLESGYWDFNETVDTFRAGAIDQLATHANRLGVRCIKSQRGGDAAAISRDAVDSAKARGEDVVIIDTAGRMQNKTNLMEELRKVHRVTQPHLVLFVADALAGNDAVTQAVEFQRILSFDGAVLCKLDTDAKGGAALSIAHATGRPIVLAGVGQGYEDLLDFDPKWLVDTVLE